MYQDELEAAVAAARVARELLLAEVNRPGGPRGSDAHCQADTDAEWLIRQRLLEHFPGYGFRGEETGYQPPAGADRPTWVVDPNDGTEAMLDGYRGHAVSIALVASGRPVLGVVFSVNAPDDNGDLIAWAEGCGQVRRNGQPLAARTWPDTLRPQDVVVLSHGAERHPVGNLPSVAPARYRGMPSIAYRLALAAAGDGVASLSVHTTQSWDFAAGQALLRGAGADLFNADGQSVRYDANATSLQARVFGGSAGVAAELRAREWRGVARSGWGAAEGVPELQPRRPQIGRLAHDTGSLQRAQGCLLGQVAGDALGALVEFESASAIARAYPDGGPRLLADGGPHHIRAGQPTDDSEMALLLARTLADRGQYDAEAVATAYARWYHGWTHAEFVACHHPWCQPFDVGGTTSQALRAVTPERVAHGQAAQACSAAASRSSQANGALMRLSPLGVWGAGRPPERVAAAARQDARLTHPHPICQDASAVYAVAISAAIADNLDARQTYDQALAWARKAGMQPDVLEALESAADGPPADFMTKQGWVLVALRNAFHQLLHADTLEDGVVATVRAGGDTDTNAAIAGALLGAVHGRAGVPWQWRQMVLSCRPMPGHPGVSQPRSSLFWPTDLLVLADLLLTSPRA